MNKQIVLVCAPLRFYTAIDENLFFTWIEEIKSIVEIKGIGKVLYLYITSTQISNDDLLNLIGLFDRYKFDNSQLKIFMNEDNKEWFEG